MAKPTAKPNSAKSTKSAKSAKASPAPKAATAKASSGAIDFGKDLRPLFGLAEGDPKIAAALAKAGKVSWTKPDGGQRYAIAKQAGLDILVERPEDAKRGAPMLVHTMFLYRAHDGAKRAQFAAPPYGLAFTTRTEVLRSMGPPVETWLIGKGAVPVTSPAADHDRWEIDGLNVCAEYDEDLGVKSIAIFVPGE